MNPIFLLFLAAAANNRRPATPGKMSGSGGLEGFRLDSILEQLQHAAHTLEKVNQLTKLGQSAGPAPVSLPPVPANAPTEGDVLQAEPLSSSAVSQTAQGGFSLPNLSGADLQDVVKNLGPLLSMLNGGNGGQNAK